MSTRADPVPLGRGTCLLRSVRPRKAGNYGLDMMVWPSTWCGKEGRDVMDLTIAVHRKDSDCEACLEAYAARGINTEDLVYKKRKTDYGVAFRDSKTGVKP